MHVSRHPLVKVQLMLLLCCEECLIFMPTLRPAKSYPLMPALRDDIDMVIVRENTEDLYTGKEFSLGDSAVALENNL